MNRSPAEKLGRRVFFRYRDYAIRNTFELYELTGHRDLTLQTIDLIDRLQPPEPNWEKFENRDHLFIELAMPPLP